MIHEFVGIVPQRLGLVRLKNDSDSESFARANNLSTSRRYVVMGEVADTGHVLLVDLRTGTVVPGLMDLAYFETIPKEDL